MHQPSGATAAPWVRAWSKPSSISCAPHVPVEANLSVTEHLLWGPGPRASQAPDLRRAGRARIDTRALSPFARRCRRFGRAGAETSHGPHLHGPRRRRHHCPISCAGSRRGSAHEAALMARVRVLSEGQRIPGRAVTLGRAGSRRTPAAHGPRGAPGCPATLAHGIHGRRLGRAG